MLDNLIESILKQNIKLLALTNTVKIPFVGFGMRITKKVVQLQCHVKNYLKNHNYNLVLGHDDKNKLKSQYTKI